MKTVLLFRTSFSPQNKFEYKAMFDFAGQHDWQIRTVEYMNAAVGVPKGTYKVRLASHGLDPTDPLTVATLTVTLAEAIPEPEPVPHIDRARTDQEGEIDNRLVEGSPFSIYGSGFGIVVTIR